MTTRERAGRRFRQGAIVQGVGAAGVFYWFAAWPPGNSPVATFVGLLGYCALLAGTAYRAVYAAECPECCGNLARFTWVSLVAWWLPSRLRLCPHCGRALDAEEAD